MLTTETRRRIDNCRDYLVGKLPLPTDQVELITLALIYKFMDDMDEQSAELGGKRAFFTGTLATYRWREIMAKTLPAKDRMDRFAAGLEALGDPVSGAHLPELFRDIFRNAFLKFRDGKTFALFATEIDGFTYSHSEELGNAFEYLLQSMATQGQNGQFRTPRHIIDFVIACLDPQPGDRLLDPACGTGGFLVAAYKHILAKNSSPRAPGSGDLLKARDRDTVYSRLSGYDITDFMVKLSKVNLFLHGFPSPDIHIYDTLSNDARWDEKADIIAANPPFMTPKGGVTPHGRFRISAKKAEVLFTDYIAEHLAPHGRAGIVVPNGIVATTQNAYVKLRKYLIEDGLVAVVSLPAGVFKPYSGVKTSILFLDKKRARQTDSVLFLKITADGFDLGDKRTPGGQDDLPEAQRVIDAWRTGKQGIMSPLLHQFVPKAELLAHKSCSLQAEHFLGVDLTDRSGEWVALGEIASFSNGGTPSTKNPEFWGGDIPWVSSKDMKSLVITDTEDHVTSAAIKSSATKLLPANTILCVVRSGILKHTFPVAITARPMCTNQDILSITPDPERLDPKYLLFLLRNRNDEILRDGVKTGVTVESFHAGFFKSLEIPLPSLDEQRRIVAEIEGYQKVIDGARQVVESYSPVLLINSDWEITPLGEIADVKLGKMLDKAKHRSGRMMPYLRNVNVRWGCIETHDLLEMYFEGEEFERFGLTAGDVLVCEGGEPGRAAVWDGRMPDLKYQKALHRVRFKVPYEPKLLVYFLQALTKTKEWEDRFHGATIKHFPREQFIELPIPLPPISEQRRIVSELEAEAAQIDAVRGLITTFDAKIRRVLDRVWANA